MSSISTRRMKIGDFLLRRLEEAGVRHLFGVPGDYNLGLLQQLHDSGYTIERSYLGKNETYNDVANWSYADLPKVFRPDTTARSFVVKTNGDLQKALNAPNDTMIFVESILHPHDASAAVITSSNKGAELDYGPRGPHRRDNVQLRPAASG